MKFEIDIDLPASVLKEWEPVAFRVPVTGDCFYFAGDKKPVKVRDGFEMIGPFLVMRRRFQWPEWLKCRYLVWDEDGTVSGWNAIPDLDNHEWTNEYDPSNKRELCASPGHAQHLGVSFPGGDWRTRIEENPNWKATT